MPAISSNRKKDSDKSKNGVTTVTTKILRIKMKGADKMANKKLKAPVNIPVEKIHPFEGHPYKVLDNDEMNNLMELPLFV